MLNYKIYLKDILEAIERIDKSLEGMSKEDFAKDYDKKDAVFMRIQIIGESIKKIPLEIKRKYKNIRWKEFAKTRDIISHAYSKVNLNLVWDLVRNKLPILKDNIKEILKQTG